MTDSIQILEGQIRECYGRVTYTNKAHEKNADMLIDLDNSIKIIQIVLSALTTVGIVSSLAGVGPIGTAISAVLSTSLLCLNSYTKDNHPGQVAQTHRKTASDLWLIREQYLSLLTDIRMGQGEIANFIGRRDELAARLQVIYANAPSTSPKAYASAQKAIKESGDMTFSQKELDHFLPDNLKRSGETESVSTSEGN